MAPTRSARPERVHRLKDDLEDKTEGGQVESAQHPVPIPVAGLAHPVQRKVAVGAVADPQEIEADEVARSVVAALRGRGSGHEHGDGCGCGSSGRMLQRHTDVQSHEHDEPTVGLAGGTLGPGAESALRASSGGGSALPHPLQESLGSAMGADLSGIRLHSDARAATLNRGMSALAFTHGRDIYFRDGMPDTQSDGGLQLLAHELTHTVQQGSAPVLRQRALDHTRDAATPSGDGGFVGAIGVRRSTGAPTVMRHAAYEHYLLGQLQPHEIALIPEVRKFKKNAAQNKNIKKKGKGLGGGLKEGDASAENRDEVKHIIDQEMARLLKFRDDPEALSGEIAKMGVVERGKAEVPLSDEEKDKRKKQNKPAAQSHVVKTWNVPVVVLSCLGGDIVVTYSEMNTMPDLFGNPEAIGATPKAKVLSLLQGVRQQLYIELSNLREELFGTSNNQLHSRALDGDFQGAAGPRAQAVNDKAYEVRTEMEVNSATTRPGQESEQYFAALERNACHFAPQSWMQWRRYHVEAVRLAKQSALNKKLMRTAGLTPDVVKILEGNAARLANEALIQNSFGEHYLQDSFAAGHLIDKTKIMQWFTLWLERTGQGLGTFGTATAQWKMAVHAAGLDLKSNPQMLHDMMVRGEVTNATEAAGEIGATSTPEIELLVRWRALAKSKSKWRSLDPKDAAAQFGGSAFAAKNSMRALVTKGMASKDLIGSKFTLEKSQLEVVDPKTGLSSPQGSNPYTATKGTRPSKSGKIGGAQASSAVAEFNLAAYNMLLSNAYVGSSTKFFHDRFCQQGLEVISGTGEPLGRIYGDSNMMNAGGQKGLKYSAETSRRSRSSVFNILSGEEDDEKYTTDDIQKRFPAKVKVDDADLPIVDFNLHLKAEGDRKLFKEAKTFGALVVYKAINGLSSKGAIDVDKLVNGIDKQLGRTDSDIF